MSEDSYEDKIASLPIHTNRYAELQKNKRSQASFSSAKRKAAVESGDIQAILDTMTGKMKAFCEEYLKDLNATQAVLRAGYATKNPKQIAYQLMEDEGVRLAIDALRAQRNKGSHVTKDWVLKNLEKGMRLAEESGNINAFLRANELIARHLGMFVDRTEISGPDGDAIRMDQRIREDVDAFTSSIANLANRSKTQGS